MYYCTKCQQNHRYTSKIGQKHLKYKDESPQPEDSIQGIELQEIPEDDLQEEPTKTEDSIKGIELLDTRETDLQEELKAEDTDQINELLDIHEIDLQEEPANIDETEANMDLDSSAMIYTHEAELADTNETMEMDSPSIKVIKINEVLADTNEAMENIDSDISADIKIDEEIVEKPSSNRIVRFIRDYQRSYQNGIEKFGIWWKVFQLSIWGIILIFIIIAGVIFVVYLPKIDMINWILR